MFKLERDRLLSEGLHYCETVYSFEGKIYVKTRKVDPNTYAAHIKTME